jgi:hypothetical protein
MNAHFHAMMQTLREARRALEAELAWRAQLRSVNMVRLSWLRRSAGEFAYQAVSLIQMMQACGGDGTMIGEAEELCTYFRDAKVRITSMLGAGRG